MVRQPFSKIEEEIDRRPEGMFDFMNAVGAHELVVETPQHTVEWPQLDDAHLEGILRTYRARGLDLRNDRRFRQVMVVKNHGRSVSQYEHPHSHVIAFPIVPRGIDEEVQGCLDFFRRKERCIYCDILREERQMQRRVIFASNDRSAHVALEFGRQASVQSMVAKDGGLRARCEKAGTYEYSAHVGIGGAAHPNEIRGKVVVK